HRRLIEAGFRVHRFDYLSVAATQQRILDRLQTRMADLAGEADAVHLVGHSLGGLLALRACLDGELPPGRIVCLGSPLKGSAAARGFPRGGRVAKCCWGTTASCWNRVSSTGTGRARSARLPAARRSAWVPCSAISPASTMAPWRSRKPGWQAWPLTAWSRRTIPACCSRPRWRSGWRDSCVRAVSRPGERHGPMEGAATVARHAARNRVKFPVHHLNQAQALYG